MSFAIGDLVMVHFRKENGVHNMFNVKSFDHIRSSEGLVTNVAWSCKRSLIYHSFLMLYT
jgi:hypothetical protein